MEDFEYVDNLGAGSFATTDKCRCRIDGCLYAIKKAKKRLLKISLKYEGPVEAPIKKNDKIGTYRIVYDQELIGEYDLLASSDVQKVNIFTRLIKSLNYLIWGDV